MSVCINLDMCYQWTLLIQKQKQKKAPLTAKTTKDFHLSNYSTCSFMVHPVFIYKKAQKHHIHDQPALSASKH